MKRLITISLLLVLSLSFVLHNAGVLISYQLNKDFISKNLCENKAKPELHCNGKCYLKKQLQKEEAETQRPIAPTFSFKYIELTFIFPPTTVFTFLTVAVKKKEALPAYVGIHAQDCVSKMLRPPAFV